MQLFHRDPLAVNVAFADADLPKKQFKKLYNFLFSKQLLIIIIVVVRSSVTRFGDILPLLQNYKSLWLFFEGCIEQNFEPNWAHFYDIGQIIIVLNGIILKR